MEKSNVNSEEMNPPSPNVSSSAFRGRRLALIFGSSILAIAWIVMVQVTLTHQPKRGEDNTRNASKIGVLRGKSGEERDSSSEHMLASDEEAALLGKDDAPSLPFESGSDAAPICHLDPSPDAAVPVILLSLGGSGSGSTWDAMGTLTGEATQLEEHTGSSDEMSKKFFMSTPKGDNGNWALSNLCKKQGSHPEAGMIGFRWKPRASSFFLEASVEGLEMIAKSHHPQNQNCQITTEFARCDD
jgi:hypothetical protein